MLNESSWSINTSLLNEQLSEEVAFKKHQADARQLSLLKDEISF
jgi:hypothetical protein